MAGGNSVVYVETEPGRFEIRPVTVGQILRDKIVILDGLKVGDQVATAGNFLIDSQMQLAGKPSLIDPTRAIAKAKERKGPLVFEQIAVQNIGGPAGKQLEELYAAYFAVHQALAADKTPPAEAAQALHRAAVDLASDTTLAAPVLERLHAIATNAEHLHHQELTAARQSFKPISHAVVALATEVRSEGADQPFTHFFCPMVKGGGGDWLQPGGELLNPYYGSEMLHCGEKVHVFPAHGVAVPEANPAVPPLPTAPADTALPAPSTPQGV
jgi:Cu(I)/Ag(I) efflux system membrane fusion protein